MYTVKGSAWFFIHKPLFTGVTLTEPNTARTANTSDTRRRWSQLFIAVSRPYLTETVQHAAHWTQGRQPSHPSALLHSFTVPPGMHTVVITLIHVKQLLLHCAHSFDLQFKYQKFYNPPRPSSIVESSFKFSNYATTCARGLKNQKVGIKDKRLDVPQNPEGTVLKLLGQKRCKR